MNWHNEILKKEQDKLAPIFKNESNIFIYYNKQTKDSFAFGSITAISQHTTLKKDKLYYHFTRLKKRVYEDDTHYIKKSTIIRSVNDKD